MPSMLFYCLDFANSYEILLLAKEIVGCLKSKSLGSFFYVLYRRANLTLIQSLESPRVGQPLFSGYVE